ncbi:hypothetical protein C3Y87_09730 [Carbonactinospora thermoautotrophica]|uniref:hypothetical protein n=1 Tax=Carbonactinospora thermoautotrophica TaxID=1469144 RepID=UPI00226FD759|nr:hypothetical protein [Carbonactinospora thermoautotrophica]MCX9191690.1 hypothetical protein [Carbonactinospora thermoautotrophica]
MSSRSLAVLGAVILCSLLTACGQPVGGKEKTLNQQQADQRAEEHIQRAVAAVFTPPPRLERQLFLTFQCKDPSDLGSEERIQVTRRYWLRDLPKERNREYFDKIHEYWTHNGYHVLEDDRADPNNPALFVEHNDDGFRMSLQANFQGDLTIGATSPCIWPNGEPT